MPASNHQDTSHVVWFFVVLAFIIVAICWQARVAHPARYACAFPPEASHQDYTLNVVDTEWRATFNAMLASFEQHGGELYSKDQSTQNHASYLDPATLGTSSDAFLITSGTLNGTIPNENAAAFMQEAERIAGDRIESVNLTVTDADALRQSCLTSRRRLRDADELTRLYRGFSHGGYGAETSTIEWAVMGLQNMQMMSEGERSMAEAMHESIGKVSVYITVSDKSYNNLPVPFIAPEPFVEEVPPLSPDAPVTDMGPTF